MTVAIASRRGLRPAPAKAAEPVGAKSYFLIERAGGIWLVSEHRRGHLVETTLCETAGEVNRVRQRLSDNGLIGYNRGAL